MYCQFHALIPFASKNITALVCLYCFHFVPFDKCHISRASDTNCVVPTCRKKRMNPVIVCNNRALIRCPYLYAISGC